MKGDALTAYAISAARSPLFHLIYNFVLNLRIFFVLRTRIYVYTFPNDPKQMLYYETRENPRGIYMYSVLSSLCSKRFLEDWVLGFTPSKGMHYYIYIYVFLFLFDEGPMLETLDYTIRIGSTPTFLYFDLHRPIYFEFY